MVMRFWRRSFATGLARRGLTRAAGFAAAVAPGVVAPAVIAPAVLAHAVLAPVLLALIPLSAHAAVEGVDAPPAVPIELQSRAEPPRPRVQSAAMAHLPLIRSEYALVVDQDTDEVLLEKKPDEVSSIASITKLMTAIVTLDAGLPLDEELQFDRDDKTTAGWVGSALHPGLRITRAQALHLALMSSENHAAQLLGRSYPGGVEAAVAAMNAKARQLGMSGAHFADPTGLSPENRASPIDLVRMVKAAYDYPQIREFSISPEYRLPVGNHSLSFRNTNHLTARADWQIGLQKTGYINAAGRCLVMQAVIEGRRVVMVLLDSFGRYSRFADAQRIRDWLVKRPAATKAGAD